jgi:ligand-binding sensor domain-containing protein/signal transduction histidine kinase/DNA-binding response OmpR family regulator
MRYLWILHIIIYLFYFSPEGKGQQILFRNYNVSDGLPSSTVRAIAQDSQGYMWFGTKNGLSRFDGYQFKTFQYQKNKPGAIGNNFIYCITAYDRTHYWIGTESGIYILDLETETFTPFAPLVGKTVFDILKDQRGKIWIASRLDGLYLYDPVNNSTNNFRTNQTATSVSTNFTTKLAQDDDGNIWIGTFGNGIDIYNPATKRFTNIHPGKYGLNNGIVNALYKAYDGVMWVGTMNGGLFKWQKEDHTFKNYQHSNSAHAIKDNIVRAIHQTSPDKLYVGTEKGLNVLDIATDQFEVYTNKSNDLFSISDNAIYSIFSDRSGTIWVGTFFGGVNYYNEKGSAFELYYPTGEQNAISGRAVSCFLEDGPGKFWVGTEDGGLHYFDGVNNTFYRYPFLPNQQKLSYHNIHSLLRDKEGNIWIGLFAGGINIYNPNTGNVSYYQQGNPGALNSNNVFSLYQDHDGIIWVGTDKGLNRFDQEKNAFTTILKEGINNTIIYDIYEDQNKTVWFATYNNGLISFNKKTQQWNRITADDPSSPLASNKLICLHDDHRGNLWIGTDGGGLNKYNYKTKQVKVYDTHYGISSNVIYGIQEDANGLIWMTTNNGIYNLDPQTEKVKHFSRQDNLQSQQFNYKAFFKASDGKLFAGGIRGFNAFYPERFANSKTNSRISFTNFQLFNKNISLSENNSPLQKQINYTKELVLTHDQSVISLEFAALNFNAPEKVRYAYKMEGFDPDWNFVGDQRKATYTNLSPGHYVFKVKATTDESNWDIPEATMTVIIKPPFYKTTLAYFIYFLLSIAAAIGIYQYVTHYIRKKNQIKLERLKNKEEQEFYARKIEFFTVMAHEIRTPLSLIIAPLEKLLSLHKWNKEENEQLQVMDENANRLLDLVNQLLDFRRIESDAYEIKKEQVEVVSLVQSVYSRFSALPYQKDIEFTMSTNISKLMVQADPEVLNKILGNLLINAFKFARSHVRLTISELVNRENAEQNLCISVEDDGIGIPNTDLKNIFKKFFTTTSGDHQYHNLGGTGIGLALASSLAERHGGRLLVESKPGSKTTFTLELPYAEEKTTHIVGLQPEEEANQELNEGQPLILIVEDDEAILSFIAKSLRSEGYRVGKAKNGKDAIQLIETKGPDLIISDVMMPVMDGFELCKAVKTNINYSHIPLVLLTAKGNREAEIEGVEAGADAYILKPFKWKHLVAVVKNLLDSRERLKEKFSEQPGSDISVLATNTKDKEFMEKVVSVIESRVIDPQLSVEELSKDMAMSRSNLLKKLKSLSGYGPNELIRLVRLKHAARLLVTNEHTIAEIAYMTGFNSPSYFSKCFQQQFKLTPKEFADKNIVSAQEDIEELINRNDIS